MDQEPSPQIPSFPKFILIVENDASTGEYLVQAIHQETPYRSWLVVSSQQALSLSVGLPPPLFNERD